MQQKTLSICISTYNRCEQCINLVNKIFRLKDERYNVIICDDRSSDNTVSILNKLPYRNLKIKENKKNLGPCKNWYHTINSGDAKYVLHVLDRDTIKISQLQYLIDLLEKYEVSGGYIGASAIKELKESQTEEKAYIYSKGKDAFLYMGGVPVHPTGFIVHRQFWGQCQMKKFFYLTDKYGIYPHSYVLAHMALYGDLLYIPSNFYSYKYIGKNSKSRFYKKNDRFWWMPESVMDVAIKLIFYLYPFADTEYGDEFIIRRFQDGLYRSTITYKETIGCKSEMEHYGLYPKDVSNLELLWISIWFCLRFLTFLKKQNIESKKSIVTMMYSSWKSIVGKIIKE